MTDSTPLTVDACPICQGRDRAPRERLHDDRFGYPGERELYACAQCGHRWLDWRPDEETLASLYTDYYPRRERPVGDLTPLRRGPRLVDWWRGRRASAAFWVPPRTRVLDIGCGFGESLAYHRMRGCDAHGVEADRNVANVAQHHGLSVRIGLFDPDAYAPESFDYVTMDQVIEHMVDPIAALRGVARVLRPDGQLVMSTPNADGLGARVFGRRWIHWHSPYHLHFFSARSLDAAAAAAGFEICSSRTVTSSEWLSYQWIHLLTAPPPGERSVFWSSAPRSLSQRALITSLRAAHRLGGDHAVTRLGDALGLGDNLVVTLRRR